MLQFVDLKAAARPLQPVPLGGMTPPDAPTPYRGPDRRRRDGHFAPTWLTGMLDEIDFGLAAVDEALRVVHINRAARRDVDESHPLQLVGHQLQARHAADAVVLRDAVHEAAVRGLRRLLRLGAGSNGSAAVAVVPLPGAAPDGRNLVQLSFGKRQVCEELTADSFARAHGLTPTEAQVLKGLCHGLKPQAIADAQGVQLCTVRTQIGSIRAKTGAESIRALVRQVSVLPPLVCVVQGRAG